MKVTGLVLQLVGLGAALLGVAVVRSWLAVAASAAVEAKRGLDRWWALLGERARRWWAHRRGRPFIVSVLAVDGGGGTDTATATVAYFRADRAMISDRDWLALLDDRMESVLQRLDRAEQTRTDDNNEHNRRLHAQRTELRAELLDATRDGWQLIVAGLLLSMLGTLLGLWA